ncbi:hypothetical protein B0H11DRAFT_2362535 [Mycena galericulata]|nr:hypothetical protein B0H11DRAFT_2362535 [Mycena galericulata]
MFGFSCSLKALSATSVCGVVLGLAGRGDGDQAEHVVRENGAHYGWHTQGRKHGHEGWKRGRGNCAMVSDFGPDSHDRVPILGCRERMVPDYLATASAEQAKRKPQRQSGVILIESLLSTAVNPSLAPATTVVHSGAQYRPLCQLAVVAEAWHQSKVDVHVYCSTTSSLDPHFHKMATPRQSHLSIQGGRGGDGGQGGQQGGGGGVGYGPIVNAGPGTMHVHYHKEAENRDTILNWFSPINFFLLQADISQVREKGTGGWLLADPLFKQWESGSGRTLWCHGIPSAGKTVLASMVVGHLGTQSTGKNIGVACIYLNHKEIENQTPSSLLAGLWRQLVLHRDIGSTAENLYKQHREKGTAPSLEEVVNVLSSCLKEFSQVFIIVDAMDEYPEFQREILLQQLAEMRSNVNLMITSRPNISPESFSFPNLATLDIQAAPGDIQAYINAQIKSSPHLSKHTRKKPELREEILRKVIDTADGMFLLAKLYVQHLSTKNTIGHVREALKEPPKGIYDSYDIAMQQIEAQNPDNRNTARSTLIWVANAKRPLTVSELTVALAIKPGARSIDEDYLLEIETILAVCAGLVIVDKESSVVRLVHYTTQEYLDEIQAEKFPGAQTEIACTLLTFLAFDGYPDSSWESENLPPLVEYSQQCLAHAAGYPEVQLREMLLRFLGHAFQWMQAMNQGMWEYEWKWNSPPWNYSHQLQPSALWIAAAANLVETTKGLLEGDSLLQHLKEPEIIVASYYGHLKIVCILLEKGANVNAAGGRYGSSLQAAAAGGHTEIVGILLEKGANVNAAGGQYGTALEIASEWDYNDVVDMLLERGARFPAPVEHERYA